MTPDQVLRIAAQHWYDHLRDNDVALDYEGFDDDLEAALKVQMIDADKLLEWLGQPQNVAMKRGPKVHAVIADTLDHVRAHVLAVLESP